MYRTKTNSLTIYSFIFYIFAYSLLIAIALTPAMLFLPFEFVNNDHSYLVCLKNGKQYELGPNFIFMIDSKGLDSFNHVKAGKLCEHTIIKDYGNTVPATSEINYKLIPAVAKDSSLLNVVFVFLVTFSLGSLLIEKLGKLAGLGLSRFGKYLFEFFQEITS